MLDKDWFVFVFVCLVICSLSPHRPLAVCVGGFLPCVLRGDVSRKHESSMGGGLGLLYVLASVWCLQGTCTTLFFLLLFFLSAKFRGVRLLVAAASPTRPFPVPRLCTCWGGGLFPACSAGSNLLAHAGGVFFALGAG